MDRRISNRDLEGDDPYLIAAIACDAPDIYPDESDCYHFWSSASVMRVIFGVGRAYGLHFRDLLGDWHERTLLNTAQAAGLAEEVEFVGDLLDDPLVTAHCQRIANIAARVAASNDRLLLALEGR